MSHPKTSACVQSNLKYHSDSDNNSEVLPVGPVCLPFNKVLHKEEEVALTMFGV